MTRSRFPSSSFTLTSISPQLVARLPHPSQLLLVPRNFITHRRSLHRCVIALRINKIAWGRLAKLSYSLGTIPSLSPLQKTHNCSQNDCDSKSYPKTNRCAVVRTGTTVTCARDTVDHDPVDVPVDKESDVPVEGDINTTPGKDALRGSVRMVDNHGREVLGN